MITPKYGHALRKILAEVNRGDEPIEIVCVVGRKLTDWKNPISTEQSKKSLSGSNMRVVTYQQLIHDAQKMYSPYLEKKREVGRISKLRESIDAGEMLGKPREVRRSR